MSFSDGISPEAGLAQKENLISETIAPRPVHGANPGGSGSRAVVVNERYQLNEPQAQTATGTGSAFAR